VADVKGIDVVLVSVYINYSKEGIDNPQAPSSSVTYST